MRHRAPAYLDLQALFGNRRPLEVDLGCGKGRFLTTQALLRPEVNFLGVDRLTRKLMRAHRRMTRRKLTNVRLFRDDVDTFVALFLPPESVSVFHVYFPDPWPKRKHRKRRFMNPDLVRLLETRLLPGGRIFFASDFVDYRDEIVTLFRREKSLFPILPDSTLRGRTDFEHEFMERREPIFRAACRKRD